MGKLIGDDSDLSESEDDEYDEYQKCDDLNNTLMKTVPPPVFLDSPAALGGLALHPQGHHGDPLPGGGPPHEAAFDWSSGELPAQEQIAAMTYEELLLFAGGGGLGTD